jgi:hypothetical protein
MDHRAAAEKYLLIDGETENSALGRDAIGVAEVHADTGAGGRGMSNAEPMGDERRRASYGIGPLTFMRTTPRQRRRLIHKERKGKWGFGYPGTKGYATYPRARAIAERLAVRRNAEAAR